MLRHLATDISSKKEKPFFSFLLCSTSAQGSTKWNKIASFVIMSTCILQKLINGMEQNGCSVYLWRGEVMRPKKLWGWLTQNSQQWAKQDGTLSWMCCVLSTWKSQPLIWNTGLFQSNTPPRLASHIYFPYKLYHNTSTALSQRT